MQLTNALIMIAMLSSKCVREFSHMSMIVSPTRASLMTKPISYIQFLKNERPSLAGLTLHCMLTRGHSEHVIHPQVQYKCTERSCGIQLD